MKATRALAAAAAICVAAAASPASAQQPFVGQVLWFGGNYCPAGWLQANGTLLPISSFDVLFSLIGTTYGGDGQTTFALPDLRGRASLHQGQGPGLPVFVEGQMGGSEQTTLSLANLAAHAHAATATAKLRANAAAAGTVSPTGATLANSGATLLYGDGPATTDMGPALSGALTTNVVGGATPFDNRKPSLAMTACIAAEGVYPQRN